MLLGRTMLGINVDVQKVDSQGCVEHSDIKVVNMVYMMSCEYGVKLLQLLVVKLNRVLHQGCEIL